MPPSPDEEFPANLWFSVEIKKAQLFQKALRAMCQSAYSDQHYPDVPAGKTFYGGMNISETDGLLLFCISTLKPTVFISLPIPISTFSQFHCRETRLLRFDLRHFEDRIATGLDGYDSDEENEVSIHFSGDKANYKTLIYGVRDGEDVIGELETSEMALVDSRPGRLSGPVWIMKYQLSIEMSAERFKELINFLSLFGTEVKATMTSTEIMFRVVNKELVLKTEAERYQIVHSEGQYPYSLEFGLDQKCAFLNAACLSNIVRLHKLTDSRAVLEMPIDGLGSLMFRRV